MEPIATYKLPWIYKLRSSCSIAIIVAIYPNMHVHAAHACILAMVTVIPFSYICKYIYIQL